MTKIVKLYPDKESDLEFPGVECTVCKTVFSYQEEGGIMGHFGMIPVQFCPMCLSSCIDMVNILQDREEQ